MNKDSVAFMVYLKLTDYLREEDFSRFAMQMYE